VLIDGIFILHDERRSPKKRTACQVAGRIARAGPSVYRSIATPLWADDGTDRRLHSTMIGSTGNDA
jgi:hypothetical protein